MRRSSLLRRLAHLVLAVALLAGWQAALEHPLVHVTAALHAQDSGADHEHPADALQECDACLAYAGFGAAAGSARELAVSPLLSVVPSSAAGGFVPRAALAFRSQAPPLFS
ncbi:MAG: hypothetical protein AB7O31_01555 [Burkholderiales bacterium]